MNQYQIYSKTELNVFEYVWRDMSASDLLTSHFFIFCLKYFDFDDRIIDFTRDIISNTYSILNSEIRGKSHTFKLYQLKRVNWKFDYSIFISL
jgi:hypothetical protein